MLQDRRAIHLHRQRADPDSGHHGAKHAHTRPPSCGLQGCGEGWLDWGQASEGLRLVGSKSRQVLDQPNRLMR